MTLFIKMTKRTFEISDLYVMALSFVLFYTVTSVVRRIIEKQRQKNRSYTRIPNPRAGATGGEGIMLTDESELALSILSCISNDYSYVVKDPTIKKVIFGLVKEKLQNESLVITPNLVRYLATRLIKNDRTLITQLGNIVLQSESRARFVTRVATSAIFGTVSALGVPFAYAALLSLLTFFNTEHCFIPCDEYFNQIPMEKPLDLYEKLDSGHLFIADENKQASIYIQSAEEVQVTLNSNAEPIVKKTFTYHKTPKKAKQVKFSDFRQIDPELSKFNSQELVEPQIPQRSCQVRQALKNEIENGLE